MLRARQRAGCQALFVGLYRGDMYVGGGISIRNEFTIAQSINTRKKYDDDVIQAAENYVNEAVYFE